MNTAADAGGDGTTQELTGEHCAFKTIAQVNAASPAAGDSILFNKGNEWREQLTVPTSGSDGLPITFGAYGSGATPIITGVEAISGWDTSGNWINESENIWYISCTNDPCRVFIDDTEYVEAANKAGIDSTYRWWYDSGNTRLYVYATENPSTAYSDMDGSRVSSTVTVYLYSKSYVILENLNIQGARDSLVLGATTNNIIIDNCNVGLYAGINGIKTWGVDSSPYTPTTLVEIKSCIIDSGYSNANSDHSAGGDPLDGIHLGGATTYYDIHDNTVKDWTHTGIGLGTDDTNMVIQYNEIYDNDISAPNTNYCRAINFDSEGANGDGDCAYNKAYRNYIHDTSVNDQINGDHNEYYYNIIHDVEKAPNYGDPDNAGGIHLAGWGGQKCHDNKIYNNVIYNIGANGIYIAGSATAPGDKENNLIRNNIIMNWGSGYYGIKISDHASVLGNTYENNCVYKSGISDVVKYRGTNSNILDFNAHDGSNGDTIGNNINYDPLFVGSSNHNFHLNPHSPCVNAGTSVSLTEDYEGLKIRHAPDIGAHENQANALFFAWNLFKQWWY